MLLERFRVLTLSLENKSKNNVSECSSLRRKPLYYNWETTPDATQIEVSGLCQQAASHFQNDACDPENKNIEIYEVTTWK